MPRLNLDIFGPDQDAAETTQPTRARKAHENDMTTLAAPDHVPPAEPKVLGRNISRSAPKFVPVGFHQEHLRLLDEAVLTLRRQGHWKASKSAIIRKLIEIHRDELPRIYLAVDGK